MYEKFKCSMYQLLFLGYMNEKQFHKCPCIECIVKPVCEQSCNTFEEHANKHFKIVSSRSLSSVEYILLYYIKVNEHLLREDVDVHHITHKVIKPFGNFSRELNKFEEKRIRNISARYKSI
jgi:hypothetical protein